MCRKRWEKADQSANVWASAFPTHRVTLFLLKEKKCSALEPPKASQKSCRKPNWESKSGALGQKEIVSLRRERVASCHYCFLVSLAVQTWISSIVSLFLVTRFSMKPDSIAWAAKLTATVVSERPGVNQAYSWRLDRTLQKMRRLDSRVFCCKLVPCIKFLSKFLWIWTPRNLKIFYPFLSWLDTFRSKTRVFSEMYRVLKNNPIWNVCSSVKKTLNWI